MSVIKGLQEIVDFANKLPDILIVDDVSFKGSKREIEVRMEPEQDEDEIQINFKAINATLNSVMTGIKVILLFDLTNIAGQDQGLSISTINETNTRFKKSTLDNPLSFVIDELQPGKNKQLGILIHSKVGLVSLLGEYTIVATGSFTSTPKLDLSSAPKIKIPPLTGGVMQFTAVED